MNFAPVIRAPLLRDLGLTESPSHDPMNITKRLALLFTRGGPAVLRSIRVIGRGTR